MPSRRALKFREIRRGEIVASGTSGKESLIMNTHRIVLYLMILFVGSPVWSQTPAHGPYSTEVLLDEPATFFLFVPNPPRDGRFVIHNLSRREKRGPDGSFANTPLIVDEPNGAVALTNAAVDDPHGALGETHGAVDGTETAVDARKGTR